MHCKGAHLPDKHRAIQVSMQDKPNACACCVSVYMCAYVAEHAMRPVAFGSVKKLRQMVHWEDK